MPDSVIYRPDLMDRILTEKLIRLGEIEVGVTARV